MSKGISTATWIDSSPLQKPQPHASYPFMHNTMYIHHIPSCIILCTWYTVHVLMRDERKKQARSSNNVHVQNFNIAGKNRDFFPTVKNYPPCSIGRHTIHCTGFNERREKEASKVKQQCTCTNFNSAEKNWDFFFLANSNCQKLPGMQYGEIHTIPPAPREADIAL